MIETKVEVSKDIEKALQALVQAKRRVANEKKIRTRKSGKPRTTTSTLWRHIIVKYFSDCHSFDEGELNCILQVALQTKECQQI